jgi:hypothetical protein
MATVELKYLKNIANFILSKNDVAVFYDAKTCMAYCIRTTDLGNSYIARFKSLQEMEEDAISAIEEDGFSIDDGEMELHAPCLGCGTWFRKIEMEVDYIGVPGMMIEYFCCRRCHELGRCDSEA